MFRKIVKYFKQKKFKKKCPHVRCTCCNNHYFDEDDRGHCNLAESLGL